MMASARQKPYAQHSLESLFARDEVDVPVRVVVCGTDPGFLGPWATDPRVEIETLSHGALEAQAGWNVYQRITDTFMRCLWPAAERGHGLVLLQDDVSLARGWLRTVRRLETEAKRRVSCKRQVDDAAVVLALFASSKFRAVDKPLAVYQPRRFYGNVAIYLSPKVLAPLHAFADQRRGEMDDIIVKRFLLAGGAHLFAINPNVAQHTGDHSTHAGGYYRSPTFRAEGHR